MLELILRLLKMCIRHLADSSEGYDEAGTANTEKIGNRARYYSLGDTNRKGKQTGKNNLFFFHPHFQASCKPPIRRV